MPSSDPSIQLEHISRHYSMGGTSVRAVDDLSLSVGQSQFLALLGSSGSGKSTLSESHRRPRSPNLRLDLVQEFFPYIESRYRAAPGRANRAISGISMGGYGALHLAFRHPQLFSSVSAHSAALIDKLPTFLAGTAPNSPRSRVLGGVFGNPPDPFFWDQNSPIALARRKSRRPENLFRLWRRRRLWL